MVVKNALARVQTYYQLSLVHFNLNENSDENYILTVQWLWNLYLTTTNNKLQKRYMGLNKFNFSPELILNNSNVIYEWQVNCI
ncbi:MAG TPA: hypothetical protein DCG18_07320 [Richelia sp.]|jgi:hypothetical protein|nr:hypothetical protein [Richelia sp.]